MVYLIDLVMVVGDVHGQYYDLTNVLSLGGSPERTKYLFLGDYVDRGCFSIEVMILLMSLKLVYPKTIFMLRGNHECKQMTMYFNFRLECLEKYDQEVYNLFDSLPVSAIINGKFIAVHGGISPSLKTIADLNKIDRFQEPPKAGLLCDILWSDPIDNENGELIDDYTFNKQRGCSYVYGADALTKFLSNNDLLSLIRAHEVQIEGFRLSTWRNKKFPEVITIFSAPNYCDMYKNKGAIIKFDVR